MMYKWFSYTFLTLLLLSSTVPFIYNRGVASYTTLRAFARSQKLSYQDNDRYNQVVKTIEKYPTLPIYFLSTSSNANDTSTSWQLIQTFYLLYPKTATEIKYATNKETLTNILAHTENALNITPFKQKEFSNLGIELHPHKEYYIYVFEKE